LFVDTTNSKITGKKGMLRTFSLDINPEDLIAKIPLSLDPEIPIPRQAFLSLECAGNMAFSKRNELLFRKRLFERLSIEDSRVYSLMQNHSRNVIEVIKRVNPDECNGVESDGLVSGDFSPVLCVTVADCLPIFIIDKTTDAFGIVHSGWKGTGIAMNAIGLLEKRYGSERSNLRVVIGPGIGPCCYSVDEGRARLFMREYGEDVVKIDHGKFFLDLKKANINLLEREGISDILVSSDCTFCNPLLSSARRTGNPDFISMLAGIGRIPKIGKAFTGR